MSTLPFEQRLRTLLPHLNERQKRLAAAVEVKTLGRGGVSHVSRVTGISRMTVYKGLKELRKPVSRLENRVRRPGDGRKSEAERQLGLTKKLRSLVEVTPRGDPMSCLLWTLQSTRELADALGKDGYSVSHPTVAKMLKELGYSLQANVKKLDGTDHPDRDRQFRYLSERVI